MATTDKEEVKYLEVTDETGDPKLPKSSRVGVHSVPLDFKLPAAQEGQGYRFISEEEARVHEMRGGLFGESPEDVPLSEEDIQDQIDDLQLALKAAQDAKAATKTTKTTPANKAAEEDES